MNPMMIAIAMDKKRRKPAGDDAPPTMAEDEQPMMAQESEDEGPSRNCVYLGGELPDLPAGEVTATVKGTVVGEGPERRLEIAEVNGVKLAGEKPEAESEDDGGAAMSDALAKEYGTKEGDQEEA